MLEMTFAGNCIDAVLELADGCDVGVLIRFVADSALVPACADANINGNVTFFPLCR